MVAQNWAIGPGRATLLELEDYPEVPGLTWGVWAEVWQGPSQTRAHFEVCVEDRQSVAQVQSRGTAATIQEAMERAEAFLPVARQSFADAKEASR